MRKNSYSESLTPGAAIAVWLFLVCVSLAAWAGLVGLVVYVAVKVLQVTGVL